MTYATAMPASWLTPDGFPRTWRHFVYGMAFIAREHLRTQLARAQATRMAGVVKDDWEVYQRDVTRVTEVPRGQR